LRRRRRGGDAAGQRQHDHGGRQTATSAGHCELRAQPVNRGLTFCAAFFLAAFGSTIVTCCWLVVR